MSDTSANTRLLDNIRLSAALVCIGLFLLPGMTGCQLSLKTPAKDFYSYKEPAFDVYKDEFLTCCKS